MHEDQYDPEGPGVHDAELFEEESETAPCPWCRKVLSAYATQCHHCGQDFEGREVWQLEPGESITKTKGWVWIAGVAALLGIAYAVFRGVRM